MTEIEREHKKEEKEEHEVKKSEEMRDNRGHVNEK
jgi:hypothetical protein